jgi:hypothetical protein
VQQALQSSRAISTTPLMTGTVGTGNEPTQLHQITEKLKVHLQRSQEDTVQATQALAQVQSTLIVQQRKEEKEQLALQAKWEEEKSQLHQSKD